MSARLFDITIPLFESMMRNLSAKLETAEAYAREKGVADATFTEARLAPDMLPLPRQVHLASDAAKCAVSRLARIENPEYPDTEVTFAELRARLAKTIVFVGSVKPEQVNGDEGRLIVFRDSGRTMSFSARDYVSQFAIPNFMFHMVTASNLMRSKGIPLGDDLVGGKGGV